jgi:homoserine acetyltransferase
MRICIAIIAIVTGLCGCATTRQSDLYAREQHKKLILAKILLESNSSSAAKKTLFEITNGSPVPGVTDEALFRLALLELETGQQKITTDKAEKNLAKLLDKFSSSSWKNHTIALKGLMDAYDITLQEKAELERTVKNLKNANAAITKENTELRQDMEKLKKLDLELERKKK